MKTPLQEFYEYMEQHQYFIGNDLFAKCHELLQKEKDIICDFVVHADSLNRDEQSYFDNLLYDNDVDDIYDAYFGVTQQEPSNCAKHYEQEENYD